MASETLELALGRQHMFGFTRERDHIHRVSGRKRRTLYWTSGNRPLYVDQVEVREARGIRNGKRALLVLYGDAMALLASNIFDTGSTAATAVSGGGSDPAVDRVPALKFLDYSEVLSVVQKSPDAVEIEHVLAEDKPKLAVGCLFDILNEQQQQQQQAGNNSESDSEISTTNSIIAGSSSSNTGGSSIVSSTTPASARVTYATLVLGFNNPAAAQAAVAALLYYRAQAAAAVHWLSEGLHLGFKCQLTAAEALPVSSSTSSSSHDNGSSSSTMWRAVSLARRSSTGCTAAGKPYSANSNTSSKPDSTATSLSSSSSSGGVRYPWICRPGLDWGCQVPVPRIWDSFVTASTAPTGSFSHRGPAGRAHNRHQLLSTPAAAAAPASAAETAAAAAAEQTITLDDLACKLDLPQGPQALVVSFTTPYGLAQATITPQIVRAAMLNSECRQVLAVPMAPDNSSSSSSSSGASPAVGFPLGLNSGVASSNTAAAATDSSLRRLRPATATAAAAASPAAAVETQVYAYLTIQIARTPEAAGTPAAIAQINPYQQSLQDKQSPPPPAAAAAAAADDEGAALKFESEVTGDEETQAVEKPASLGGRTTSMFPTAVGLTPRQLQLVRLSMYVLLAATLCSSSSTGRLSLMVLLQLLLLLCVAAADLAPLWQQQQQQQLASLEPQTPSAARATPATGTTTSSSSTSSSTSTSSSSSGTEGPQQSAFAAAAATGASFTKQQPGLADHAAAAVASECPVSGVWSLLLLEGDIVSTPSPFLQLQIAALSCDQQTAELRAQLTATRSDLAAAAAAAAAHAKDGTVVSRLQKQKSAVQMPVLVSDPEPAWLDEDTKQRFINAKPTLDASRHQALATDEWRRRRDVDNVFKRPAPMFEAIEKMLPFYSLGVTPERHAVVYQKLGGIKALTDAIFNTNPPLMTADDLESHLTLINEYLVRIAAPGPLPAGNQVLLFDLSGMKLGHVMSESAFSLFQVLMRFGIYYPEHLQQAIIMHAPAWFNIPWKIVASFLDANTRSKIVVVTNPKSALKMLCRHLGGIENVPADWGGECRTPLEQFPAHQQLVKFVHQLNAPVSNGTLRL